MKKIILLISIIVVIIAQVVVLGHFFVNKYSIIFSVWRNEYDLLTEFTYTHDLL
jgi:hypothetical protein